MYHVYELLWMESEIVLNTGRAYLTKFTTIGYRECYWPKTHTFNSPFPESTLILPRSLGGPATTVNTLEFYGGQPTWPWKSQEVLELKCKTSNLMFNPNAQTKNTNTWP